jgi:hypothetical protein
VACVTCHIDRTVQVPTLNALSTEEWIGEFERLRALNAQLLGNGGNTAPKQNQALVERSLMVNVSKLLE